MNGPVVSSDDIQSGLKARIDSFRQSDEARNNLLEQVIHEYQALRAQHQETCNDLTNEAASRRQWQNQYYDMKRDLEDLRLQTESSLFALVIIDGDGAIFQDHLLRAGADGGSEAGYLLFGEIKKHLQERHGPIGNWNIMVQIYANFDGLSRKLAQVGLVRSPFELNNFARAFSCSQPLFSFIDVGMGKERADHKIKEMLRLFMFNTQCKHIMFGGTHDNGYLPNLEPFKRDNAVTTKLTLLATTPPERGFLGLGMDVTKFSSVFRTDPLPERYLPERSLSGTANQHPPALAQPNLSLSTTYSHESPVGTPPPQNGHPQPQQRSDSSHASQPDPSPITPTSISAPQRNVSANPAKSPDSESGPVTKVASVSPALGQAPKTTTYAGVSDGTATAAPSKPMSEKPGKPRKAVYLNAYDQRVDLVLPKPEPAAITALHQRIKERKVCNNFHLLGSCSAGLNCPYSHEPKLPAKEVAALRVKARERPCMHGLNCRDLDCLSGHICPRGQDCSFDYCYFGDESHEVERAVKMKYYGSGDVEIVR